MESAQSRSLPQHEVCCRTGLYVRLGTDVQRYQYFKDNHLVDSLYLMLASVVQMLGLRCIA
jgi:hypothetical protein